MSLPVDTDYLLRALASALARHILPSIDNPDAKLHAEAALGLITRNVLAMRDDLDAYRRETGLRLEKVRTALSEAGAELPLRTNDKLRAVLNEDLDWHRRFHEKAADALKALNSPHSASFRPPTAEEMTACLRRQFPEDAALHARSVRALQGGGSKQTVMFEKVSGAGVIEPLVMRRDFPDPYFGNTVEDEFPVIKALHSQGFAAPEPIWLDASCTCLPEPFMVTRAIVGLPGGGPRGPNPDVVKDPMRLMADLFARLHAIHPSSLQGTALSNVVADEKHLAATLELWESRYLKVVSTPAVAVLMAFAWLRANRHAGVQDAAIVHGDPGFHNILVDEAGNATLLDWEFVHVGSPAEDLGYVRGQLRASGPFEKFLDLYEARGGHRPSDEALRFYEVFRLARGAVMFATKIAEFNAGYSDQMPGANGAAYLYNGFVKQLSKRLEEIST